MSQATVNFKGMTWNSRDDSGLYRVPERLPAPETSDWVKLCGRILDYFLMEHSSVRPRPRSRSLLIIHPNQIGLLEQARAIHNGEVEPGSDEEGNVCELPRVWRWEHHFHLLYVIELPEGMNARSILLWSGDRELDVA